MRKIETKLSRPEAYNLPERQVFLIDNRQWYKKLSPDDLYEFVGEYHRFKKTTYHHLRFGQAFLNTFYPDIADSEVFYCSNLERAVSLIIEKYIFFPATKETLVDILWKNSYLP